MILRIHDSNNAQNINADGWAPSAPLTKALVATIQDPHGANASKEISSIPSPFGRMDLVRAAFRTIVESKEVDGNKLHHKLVSDALDVAQIVFHLERFQKAGYIELVRWERQSELQALGNSAHKGHRELGKALDKYLQQDAQSFNFNNLQSLALLVFVHPMTKVRTVLGGTSPVSLFFSAPGDLGASGAPDFIKFGKDKPFDDDYCSLHKRDQAFVVWLYALAKHYAPMSSEFKELYDYLDLIRRYLPDAVQASVNTLTTTSYTQDYTPLYYSAGNPLHLFPGLPLHGNQNNINQIVNAKCQFVINPKGRTVTGVLPLVLPTVSGYGHLYYISAQWDTTTTVPKSDDTPLGNRTLPGDGSQYPYLTQGDFFSERLIRLKNTIDEDNFYAGEGQGAVVGRLSTGGYLLPLKPLFFDYFTHEELRQEKMLSFRAIGSSVEVTLRIPIRGGEIVYQQTYEEPIGGTFGQIAQVPTIEELDIELALMCNKHHSHIACVLPQSLRNIKLRSYVEPQPAGDYSVADLACAIQNGTQGESVYTAEVIGRLSLIELSLDGHSAFVLPMEGLKVGGENKVSYAVDLGTTNSSISYKLNGDSSKLLSWEKGVYMSLTKFDRYADGQSLLESRLVLPKCGVDGLSYAFPLRTALRVDKERAGYQKPYQGYSPSFTHQVAAAEAEYSEVVTGIKRDANAGNKHLEAYVESLCVLIAQHAEMLEAEVERLVWLYPSSMNRQGRKRLGEVWTTAAKTYLGAGCSVQHCNEAVAPYYHLSTTMGMLGSAVSMDIGGETVDVLFTGATEQAPKHLSSSRLGGNTLFGSASNARSTGSAFARLLCAYLQTAVAGDTQIAKVCKKMQEHIINGRSEEAVELYFALSKRSNLPVDLELSLDKLLDRDSLGAHHLRALALLYFSVQVYQIAELNIMSRLERPRFFVFSGTGSRILQLIGDEDLLSELVSFVYDEVYHSHGDTGPKAAIQIRFSDDPKVATAHGAVTIPPQGIEAPKSLLLVTLSNSSKDDVLDASLLIDGGYDFTALRDATLKDVASFAQIFAKLNTQLRLERDCGYTRESLSLIAEELRSGDNEATFDSFVKGRLVENQEISEGAICTLMSERIRMIGVKLADKLLNPKSR